MQWKSKGKAGLLMAALAVGGLALPGHVSAQNTIGINTSFATSITYQNVGTDAATIVLNVYAENSGTPIAISRPVLAKGAGTSVFVGNLTEINAGFKGAAVMEANQPIVATMVQIPSGTVVKNRPLINGFSEGSTRVLIATVLKQKFNSSTQFSVQNVGTSAATFTLKFYNAENLSAAPIVVTTANVPASAAKYYDAHTMANLPTPFNGSVTIESTGPVVAAAMELSTNSISVSGFEGVASGAKTLYMPSALCNAFGGQGTAYAVQNTSTTGEAAAVKVTYSNGTTASANIPGGAKASFIGCQNGLPAGFSGSATITSVGADIVGIGKVSGAGLSTAFVGATTGADTLALPYVRFTQTRFDANAGNRQRTFIAIQNVGAPIAAGQVSVRYLDKDGNIVGTHTINTAIPTGGKVNSNPTNIGSAGNEFGYSGTQFGGSSVIVGPVGSKLVAVARVTSFLTSNTSAGEDYNGIPIARQ